MKEFLSENFLLESPAAVELYHDWAKDMPIIDYHNHLPPKDIALNRKFNSITEAWLEGDHYKWRAMRTMGVNEEFITGNKSAELKFRKWCDVVPFTLRNPLYHWTHLELKRYFGIDQLINHKISKAIFNNTTAQLQNDSMRCQGLLQKMNVETVCTTDDPIDDLGYHKKYAEENHDIKMLPAFRPDKAYSFSNIEKYLQYISNLEIASGKEISDFDQLINSLHDRIDFFHKNGCRLADHGLEFIPSNEDKAGSPDLIFKNILKGNLVSEEESQKLRFHILIALCRKYKELGWVQQFHLGAIRNNNSRMFKQLGPDTGFDSIGDFPQAKTLSYFLSFLDNSDELAKTIIYNLNPSDNELFGTMIGNFNDGSIKGKVQFGSAWWFLDQKDGMEKQLNVLSNMGLLSCFVGMLTDSRSFLSFPRHEYFRRILCNIIGKDITNGELPNDMNWIGKVVQDICYHNAKEYFKFE